MRWLEGYKPTNHQQSPLTMIFNEKRRTGDHRNAAYGRASSSKKSSKTIFCLFFLFFKTYETKYDSMSSR